MYCARFWFYHYLQKSLKGYIQETLFSAVQSYSQDSMENSTKKAIAENSNNCDLAIALDKAWRKIRLISLDGFVGVLVSIRGRF